MNKKLVIFAKYLWVFFVVFFLLQYLDANFVEIKTNASVIPFANLAMAFISLLLGKVMLSFVASLSVRYTTARLPFFTAFSIYNLTQLAKYIPGSIWQFVGKAGAYKKEGLSTNDVKNAMILEMVYVLFSAFAFGSVILGLSDMQVVSFIYNKFQGYFYAYLVLFILLVTIGIYFRNHIKDTVVLVSGKNVLNLKMTGSLLLVWCLLGFALFITVTPYVHSLSLFDYFSIAGLYALAYFIGFLVPFAPAGVGIREGVLIAGLSSLVSIEQAIVIASLNRFVYFFAEIIIAALILLCKKFQKNSPLT